MRKLLLPLLVFLPVLIAAQNADTIIWSGNQLAWDDFKGNYDTAVYNRKHLAITSWKVRYQYRPLLRQNKLDFIIYAWFDANKSWVRPKSRNSKSLLLHEQGHFDLAEILTRQFKQRLSQTNFSRTNYVDSIKQIFSKLLIAAYATQEKYDTETSYGMNNRRQAYWQNFITTELNKLDKFSKKNIRLPLE